MTDDENAGAQPPAPAPEPETAPKEPRFGFLKKAQERQRPRLSMRARWAEWMRVLQIARKPTKDEFVSSSKVSAAGIAIIGAIGLVIFLVFIGLGI